MKRCPECRRDYYDDTLLYCLDDGNALLEGPASMDEPTTAILHSTGDTPGEAPTRAQIHTTEQTAVLPSGIREPLKNGIDKRLLAAPFLLAIIALGGFFGYRYFTASDSGQINSIAVLPFENRSGNADAEYLSDGLADSLIYRLSQLPNLKVSPTSSVFRYKGKEVDPQNIAKELGVDAVMTGRITQRGDNLTISVNLVDTRSGGKSLWGEQYERKMSELLATQREIAGEITNKLQLKLTSDETKGQAKSYTDNNDAYQIYLKGRYHFSKRTKDDFLKGIDYYQQAIELDPNFALAYAGIAYCYNSMAKNLDRAPNEAIPQAKSAAKRALEIDPTLAEAHAALADSLAIFDWDWAKSESEFKKAIELNPNVADIHMRYGISYLIPMGRTDDAIMALGRAVELEPLTLIVNAQFASAYLCARRNDKTLEQAKKTYDFEPNFGVGKFALGEAYLANAMYEDAIVLAKNASQNSPLEKSYLYILGQAYAKSGRIREANQIIDLLAELAETQYVPRYFTACIYSTIGDKDRAFAELERSIEQHDWFLYRLKTDASIDPLRDDPRFKAMLKRMNLPE